MILQVILARAIIVVALTICIAVVAAHADALQNYRPYRGPTTPDDPLYRVPRPYDPKVDYRPNYDTRPWEAAEPPKVELNEHSEKRGRYRGNFEWEPPVTPMREGDEGEGCRNKETLKACHARLSRENIRTKRRFRR
jgi:hypothetical protein